MLESGGVKDALGFVTAVAVFAVAIEVARRVAVAMGAVARPNPLVRSHRRPVPYLGGTALVLAWLAMWLVPYITSGRPLERAQLLRAACALAFVAFGTLDDLRAFSPRTKFSIQLAICAVYLMVASPTAIGTQAIHLFVLVSLVNAFNLVDVMDGLLCVIVAITLGALLVTPGLTPGSLRPEMLLLLAGLAALFAFNAPTARIYSGDAGSMTLGFVVGTWLLAVAHGASPLRTLSLVGVIAAPVLELLILVPARLRRGVSPFRGSPDHFALRLQDQLGWSKWSVLAATAALASMFALAPWVAGGLRPVAAGAVAVVLTGAGASLWYLLWRIPPRVATDRSLGASADRE